MCLVAIFYKHWLSCALDLIHHCRIAQTIVISAIIQFYSVESCIPKLLDIAPPRQVGPCSILTEHISVHANAIDLIKVHKKTIFVAQFHYINEAVEACVVDQRRAVFGMI